MKQKNVAVINFNTPDLVEAAILSIKKHGGEDYRYYVFDNSDSKPFRKRMKGVKRFDNTKGQIIDLDKELEKYPERDAKLGCDTGCDFGSDRHMITVQKMWDLIPDGFILIDSDILIRESIDFMFMEDMCCCGHVCKCNGPYRIERLAPMLLWINVPLCKAGGATFFDPDRAWALHKGVYDKRNCWDTGAAFLDDIRRPKPQCRGWRIDIRPIIVHLGNGSWRQNKEDIHKEWLDKHADLWR